MLGGIGLDVASTAHVMGKGGREANPVYGQDAGMGKIAAINALLALVAHLGLDRVAKTHPKAATGLATGLGAFRGGVGVRNLMLPDKE